MVVHIRRGSRFGERVDKVEMTAKEIYDLRKQTRADIEKWFNWDDYYPINRHLLIYAELDGEGYLYENGFIMSDKEYDELVAFREGLTFADTIHRL